jgi:NAD(P)-dependent dehydrogenase (short-subunit alcohol dehydrogenase family)
MRNVADKLCLVTGATSGIGRVTAESLARQGAKVVLVGRHRERTQAAVREIQSSTGNSTVEFLCADLSDQSQIHRLAEEITGRYPRLDILVNNAGAIFGKRLLSADGIEMTLALNHLAYFLLTLLLQPLLRAASRARIINVASEAHRGVTLRLQTFQKQRRYSGWQAYKQSKLCNLLFTYALARRLEGSGITVNALHPGFVATPIGTSHGLLPSWVWRALTLTALSPEEGARTSIYLASAPEVEHLTGNYFVHCQPRRSSEASYDHAAAEQLWGESIRLTGLAGR